VSCSNTCFQRTRSARQSRVSPSARLLELIRVTRSRAHRNIRTLDALVRRSPLSPTQILSTSLWMRIVRIGFSVVSACRVRYHKSVPFNACDVASPVTRREAMRDDSLHRTNASRASASTVARRRCAPIARARGAQNPKITQIARSHATFRRRSSDVRHLHRRRARDLAVCPRFPSTHHRRYAFARA